MTEINPMNYVTANRFYVEIGGELAASFSECSGLDISIEKDSTVTSEGGVNDQQRVFLKNVKFGDITLKRGITDDITFWKWLNELLDTTKKKKTRRNITIIVFNQAGETMQSWTLIGAVPIAWKTPAFQADGNSVAVEELTIAFEGLQVSSKPSGGSAVTGLSRDTTGTFGSKS